MYRRSTIFDVLKSAAVAVVFVAMCVALVGCGDSKPRSRNESADPDGHLSPELQEIKRLGAEFEEAIASDPISESAPQLFERLLAGVVLFKGLPDADALFREHYQRSAEMAERGYRAVVSSFSDTNTYPAFIIWADDLLSLPLPESLAGRVFSQKLGVMVLTGQVGEAQDQLLHALSVGGAKGDIAFGSIARALLRPGSNALARVWTQRLLELDLSESQRTRALGWHLVALSQINAFEEILERIPKDIAGLPEGDLVRIFRGICGKWVRDGQYDWVTQTLASLRGALPEGHGLESFLFTEEIRVLVADGHWQDARARFEVLARDVSSEARVTTFRLLHSGARVAKDWANLDRLSAFTIDTFSEDPQLRDNACASWIECARALGQFDQLKPRLERMLSLGVSSRTVLHEYSACLYCVMTGTQNRVLAELMAVGDAIEKTLSDLPEKEQLMSLMFDGAFMLEDYERVLTLLDAGIPRQNEDWHAMAKNKVLAHIAMKKGDLRGAANRFRDFMGYVDRTWVAPQLDASTGVLHTREMALGFNAKRVADLLREAGESSQAETVYREALYYYRKGLANAEEGSKAHSLITQAISELTLAVGAKDE